MVRGKRNELTDETVRAIVAARGLLTAYQVGRKYGIAATRVAGYWNAVQDDASADELEPHVSGKLAAVGPSRAGRKAAGVRETKNFSVQTGALQAAKIGKQSYSASESEACEPHQSALADSLDVILASIDAQGGPTEAAPTDTRQALRIAKKMRATGELSAREHTDIAASLKTHVQPPHTSTRSARQPQREQPAYEPEPEPEYTPRARPVGGHRQDRPDSWGGGGGNSGRGVRGGAGRSGGGRSDRVGGRDGPRQRAHRWSASSSGSDEPQLPRREPHRRTVGAREDVHVTTPPQADEMIGSSIIRARVRY